MCLSSDTITDTEQYMDQRKNPRGPVIRSKVNKGKSQDEVVRTMDRKLAGGADLSFRKELEEQSKKASVVLLYGGIYLTLLVVALLSFGWIKTRKPIDPQRASKFVEVTTRIDSVYQEYGITVDEYARYLMYLLVRYRDLPPKFQQGVPRFTREEVYAKLREVWPELTDDTRNLLFRHIPAFYESMRQAEEPPDFQY